MKSRSGFTIVELAIVIAVVAILATITIVAYRGVQDRAYATHYLSAIDAYEKTLRQYKTFNGAYPNVTDLPSGVYFACLGGPFPAAPPLVEGECYNLSGKTTGRSSPQLNAALSTITDPLPTANKTITYQDSSDIARLRGILYIGGSLGVSLIYIIAGDQSCARGYKLPMGTGISDDTMTYCSLSLN
jgi:prepilin-type N-terminal cleavage/methylation domain-containing protein